MAQPTLGETRAGTALLKRLAMRGPIVLALYAASSLALGYGFGNWFVDVVGLTATAGGYAAGDIGIRAVTNRIDAMTGISR